MDKCVISESGNFYWNRSIKVLNFAFSRAFWLPLNNLFNLYVELYIFAMRDIPLMIERKHTAIEKLWSEMTRMFSQYGYLCPNLMWNKLFIVQHEMT